MEFALFFRWSPIKKMMNEKVKSKINFHQQSTIFEFFFAFCSKMFLPENNRSIDAVERHSENMPNSIFEETSAHPAQKKLQDRHLWLHDICEKKIKQPIRPLVCRSFHFRHFVHLMLPLRLKIRVALKRSIHWFKYDDHLLLFSTNREVLYQKPISSVTAQHFVNSFSAQVRAFWLSFMNFGRSTTSVSVSIEMLFDFQNQNF